MSIPIYTNEKDAKVCFFLLQMSVFVTKVCFLGSERSVFVRFLKKKWSGFGLFFFKIRSALIIRDTEMPNLKRDILNIRFVLRASSRVML